MNYEPAIDHERLIQTVRILYGLPVERLSFVPIGFDAACYTLHCAGSERYFLKLWLQTRTRYADTAQREHVLALVRALYERGLYPRVPYPIPARDGALWAQSADGPFAVFPFLPGRALPDVWPAALQDEFGRTIAAIHRATPGLADLLPPRETFAIPFEADLRRGVAALQQIGTHDRPGLRALKALILPRQDEILAQLARLHCLQHRVRRLSGPFVLCHTDIGGDNLLMDQDGLLYVLDWDGVTLAPPEHDLQEARWVGMERVLRSYGAAGGAGPLHLDHFAFYLLRRHLHDMTVRFMMIMQANGSAGEDQDALAGITAWGFDQWSALDSTLAGIETVLSHIQ